MSLAKFWCAMFQDLVARLPTPDLVDASAQKSLGKRLLLVKDTGPTGRSHS